jgi:hypothetical protein
VGKAGVIYTQEMRQRRVDNQRRFVQRKQDLIQAYKLERGCADCGYNAHAEALDLDHRDPSEKHPRMRISKTSKTRACFQLLSWADLKAELPKCDVVCANCHRVRTQNRRVKVPFFGG